MKEQFFQFVISLYDDVPVAVYEGLGSFFVVGLIVIFAICGWKQGWRISAGLSLSEYVCLIYCSTVFFRPYSEEIGYNLTPFWSYYAIQTGEMDDLIAETIMNVVVFVPVGLLLGCAFCSINWWKVILIGGGLSVSIETMQFFLKRGFAETDDVMHNTLGCMIGYGIYLLGEKVYEKLSKRFVAVL